MTVYACFECYDNGQDFYRKLARIVDNEAKAIAWKDDTWKSGSDQQYREYQQFSLD